MIIGRVVRSSRLKRAQPLFFAIDWAEISAQFFNFEECGLTFEVIFYAFFRSSLFFLAQIVSRQAEFRVMLYARDYA